MYITSYYFITWVYKLLVINDWSVFLFVCTTRKSPFFVKMEPSQDRVSSLGLRLVDRLSLKLDVLCFPCLFYVSCRRHL